MESFARWQSSTANYQRTSRDAISANYVCAFWFLVIGILCFIQIQYCRCSFDDSHTLSSTFFMHLPTLRTPVRLLWSPYVIGQTIIFMVALWNRETIYIFILFLSSSSSSSSSFFPRLISAVGDWMSTILRHMVWS